MRPHTLSESVFASLFADSCWIKFSKLLLRELTTDEAVLLCYLINVKQLRNINHSWFYAKMKYVMRDLWFSRDKQTRVMSRLKAKGFIDTKLAKKLPANRLIRINFTRIKDSITDAVDAMAGESSVLKSADTGVRRNADNNTRIISLGELPSGASPCTFEEHCCQHFKDAIHDQTRRVVQWKIKNQAPHIKAIASRHRDKEDFLDVFEWYCTNLKRMKPRCYSPDELRNPKVWDWITDQYERSYVKEVPIGEDTKYICKTLNHMHWPKGSKEQLPQLVQQSLDEYKDFLKRMERLADEYAFGIEKRQTVKLAQYLVKKFSKPNHFVEQWFRELNGRVQGWSNWQGDLSAHQLTHEHARFMSIGRDMAAKYSSKLSFDKLIRELYAKG